MGELSITKATASDLTNRVTDWEVTLMQTDAATGSKEYEYINSSWSKQWGYFNTIAELKSAILLKATWNVGKGYETDVNTSVILDHIRGNGKETFEDILFNLEVCKHIGGDGFAEIMRDKDSDGKDVIINLKVLDPGKMKIIVDGKGKIIRYEQINMENKDQPIKLKPEDILHLSNYKLSDQVHGISDIDAVEKIIKADAESFQDLVKLMHRQAKPMILWKLNTDDQTKIDEFVAKMDAATNKGENMYIPSDKDMVSFEIVEAVPSPVILSWRNDLRNKFYSTIALPQLVPGTGGQSTESESKVIYLAFQQLVERDQKQIEKQLWNQLNVKIDLIPPATIEPALNQDEAKDAMQGLEMQPSDMQAGVGR